MFFFVVDSCAVIMWKCATLIAYFSCQSMSAVCPKKNKTDYFIVQRQQTATKRSNVWYSDLRDNCESTYDYVFHITCIMPLPGKTFHTRKCKTPNSKILSINLTHWTMKTPQNVLKMSTVSPDISRETATPPSDGSNNNWLVSFLHSTNSLLFQFCKTSLK